MTSQLPTPSSQAPLGLPALSVLRARVTMRLFEDTTLPAYKGGMLRGGFGYAFQRSSCPQPCWNHADHCVVGTLCPYRWVFETPHPPDVQHLHDLQDVPRPFVIEPPLDNRTQYNAGDALEFGLVLIGRGIDYLPYFLFGFEHLGMMGLGRWRAKARLERVEALQPWQPVGHTVYQDGRVTAIDTLPVLDSVDIAARAATLPADLRLTLLTPTRIKTHGDWLRTIAPPALVQAAAWRLGALATFHGSGPWIPDRAALLAQAAAITVERATVRWEDWERTSTRETQPRTMTLGGIVGSAVLRGVSPELRAVLLAASSVHIGKACVFGHGRVGVEGMRE